MSAERADAGAGAGDGDPSLSTERSCPGRDCQGFGAWHGDRDGADLIVRCVDCGHRWTAPDPTEGDR